MEQCKQCGVDIDFVEMTGLYYDPEKRDWHNREYCLENQCKKQQDILSLIEIAAESCMKKSNAIEFLNYKYIYDLAREINND